MKKALLIIFTVLANITANAQKLESGDLSILKTEKHINLTCDFSECIIDGKPAEFKIKEEGEDWDKGVKEIISRFTEGCANKNHNNIIGYYPDAKYTMVYHILDIDDDEDTKGYIELIDSQTKEVKAKIAKCNGNAGSFGSFYNLVGDAFENLGGKIGNFIKKI